MSTCDMKERCCGCEHLSKEIWFCELFNSDIFKITQCDRDPQHYEHDNWSEKLKAGMDMCECEMD